ncbi:MAG: universal stress protein [Micrococcales bacterium]|nr:universal stress protein [Micrococcales bacterium]MCL2666123.1 universal stress protein [Micrococcales bacterium]
MARPPQPDPSRLTPFGTHPAVVGLIPGLPDLVTLTAVSWASAAACELYFAYVDPLRYTIAEFPDGTVRHADIDPDVDNNWKQREAEMESSLHDLVGTQVSWHFRYLAGRPDRALTHLARAVDAAVIMVGTSTPGLRSGLRRLLNGSVATHLSHHQHRPVLVVPLRVVDWKDRIE